MILYINLDLDLDLDRLNVNERQYLRLFTRKSARRTVRRSPCKMTLEVFRLQTLDENFTNSLRTQFWTVLAQINTFY